MPESDVEKVKERINIAEVIGQYVQLRRAGRTYVARCPFHKERTPSFHVSPERGTYKCFGCGEGGDVFSFLEKIEGIDFPTALTQLAERSGVTLTPRKSGRGTTPQEKEHAERLREVCEAATVYFEDTLQSRPDVKKYLTDRGLTEKTIATWRLGYAPAHWQELSEHLFSKGFSKAEVVDAGLAARSEKKPGEIYDRFRGRVMFPLCDTGGKAIAFSGRFFEKVEGQKGDEPAKYVNSPETELFKKSKVLFGLDKARAAIRKANCILLVEGQFDVVLAHQSGLPFTVALSGTALTEEHLFLMGRLSKRLVLALDADAAGIKAGLKSAAMALKAGFDVKVPVFPPGKDPADLARENPELLKAAVRSSKTAIEFFLDTLRTGARDEQAYVKRVESTILPLVALLPSSLEQAHFTRLLGSRLGIPEEAVRQSVAMHPPLPEEPFAEPSQHIHSAEASLPPAPLERKAAMLLFYFPPETPQGEELRSKLVALLGGEEIEKLVEKYSSQAETLRFLFEKELGEHTHESTIANDMIADIEREIEKKRFKMRFV